MTLPALLPERPDFELLGPFAVVGAVLFGSVARIRRRRGADADVNSAAVTGAYWGGVVGLVLVFLGRIGA